MIRQLLREFSRRLNDGEPRDEILKDMGGKFAKCNLKELQQKLVVIVKETKHRKEQNLIDKILTGTPYGKDTKEQKQEDHFRSLRPSHREGDGGRD